VTVNRLNEARRRRLADPAFAAQVASERALMMEIDLRAAREATGMSQQAVADVLHQTQENVSRIERQRDVLVSTLVELVAAQGGTVEITAVFDQLRVPLLRPVSSTPEVVAPPEESLVGVERSGSLRH
jgi:transcriptional regulator with XRE-family HTH domain